MSIGTLGTKNEKGNDRRVAIHIRKQANKIGKLKDRTVINQQYYLTKPNLKNSNQIYQRWQD